MPSIRTRGQKLLSENEIHLMNLKEKYREVLKWFDEHMPKAETELDYGDPFQLVVSVILSAQCTDKRVNKITPELFRRFPDPVSMADAGINEIFELIKSCSYPNNKARHLRGMARMIVNRYSGSIPSDISDLIQLPGVGRKTANVIASVVWKSPVIAVDTHVFRVSVRLGLTPGAKNPLQVERQLTDNIPEEKRPLAHHWLLLHGRYICTSRNPDCKACGLAHLCTYNKKTYL